MNNSIELSIVLPCLNEAETLEICIRKAFKSIEVLGLQNSSEVVIADNGSTDGSQEIAIRSGARVVDVKEKGYGNALIGGIKSAKGRFVIMGDADDSYSLDSLDGFVHQLRDGADLVMGNRFAGVIEKGAMPFLHKYLGNPVLSFLGRTFFKTKISDFHCGLRGFNRDKVLQLNLQTTGMEFASELVVRSVLSEYKIVEVPTNLKKDGRSRPPHLNTWRDGWRHLVFLLSYSPKWLFLYPGLILGTLGLLGLIILFNGDFSLSQITLGLQSLIFCGVALNLGHQLIWFSILSQQSSIDKGFLPESQTWQRKQELATSKLATFSYVGFFFAGVIILSSQAIRWINVSFGDLNVSSAIRGATYGSVLISLGLQGFLSQFLLNIVIMKKSSK